MQNQMIRLAVATEMLKMDLAERAATAVDRARDEEGQTAAEYLGIVLVVSVIIAAIAGSGIGDQIVTKIGELIDKIAGGETGKKGA